MIKVRSSSARIRLFIKRDIREVTPCLQTYKDEIMWAHAARWQLPTRQENRPQNKTYFANILILDFLTSKTVRNKFLLFKSPLCSIYLQCEHTKYGLKLIGDEKEDKKKCKTKGWKIRRGHFQIHVLKVITK